MEAEMDLFTFLKTRNIPGSTLNQLTDDKMSLPGLRRDENKPYFLALQQMIEEMAERAGGPVVLVAHSMGNMYMLYFLNHQPQAWKDKYIRDFVALGAPWGGVAKALRVIISGDNNQLSIIKPLLIRVQQRTTVSTNWMLPYPSSFSKDKLKCPLCLYKDYRRCPLPLLTLPKTDDMLAAVMKLCCGISYPHLMSMDFSGQEVTQRWAQLKRHARLPFDATHKEPEDVKQVPVNENQLFYMQQAQEAMRKALSILEDTEGWKVEITKGNSDVICSKVMPGGQKVFRLEGVLEASVGELYEVLFVRVEEMHQWNPSVQKIKVLKHVGPQTMITHEVSAETTGNLIGPRDFLSIRHSCKLKSGVYMGGAAIELEWFPPQAGFVRAQGGPTCMIITALDGNTTKCHLTWLLNLDLKGWLPKSVVHQALPRVQLDFTRHLRRRLSLS